MRHNPTSILRFLAEHYEVIRAMHIRYQGMQMGLQEEDLQEIEGVSEILDRLLSYKIFSLRYIEGRTYYQPEEHYLQFFTFLSNDFLLDLPDQLGKYASSVKGLFEQLKKGGGEEHLRLVIRKMIEEINRFLSHLEDSTHALEREADDLRANQSQQLDYGVQIRKANYLIHTFLHPLNFILSSREEAMGRLLQEVKEYVHQEMLGALDMYVKEPYQALFSQLTFVEERIQWHLSKVIHSLIPLIDQIRLTNQILQGFKLLRDWYMARKEAFYASFLPKLVERKNHSTYSYYREGNASALMADYMNRSPVIVQRVEEVLPLWKFPKEHYRHLLLEALPLTDFYSWCYEMLVREHKVEEIDQRKFFKLASFVLERRFLVGFHAKKVDILLKNVTLTVPQISIEHAVSKVS